MKKFVTVLVSTQFICNICDILPFKLWLTQDIQTLNEATIIQFLFAPPKVTMKNKQKARIVCLFVCCEISADS